MPNDPERSRKTIPKDRGPESLRMLPRVPKHATQRAETRSIWRIPVACALALTLAAFAKVIAGNLPLSPLRVDFPNVELVVGVPRKSPARFGQGVGENGVLDEELVHHPRRRGAGRVWSLKELVPGNRPRNHVTLFAALQVEAGGLRFNLPPLQPHREADHAVEESLRRHGAPRPKSTKEPTDPLYNASYG